MRHVVVATHGHCFDGLCSAVMFTRLLRHLHPNEELSFTYRAQGYGPGSNGVDPTIFTGQDNAVLDFRFSQSPQLTWYFDHHVSAFPSSSDRETYEARLRTDPSDPRDSADSARAGWARQMFHDGGYGSCTKLIADVGAATFGLDVSAQRDLVRWADMIDSAAFPSAEMAVAKAEPVLHLVSVVENHGNDAFLQAMVPRLLEESLESVAAGADVEEAYAPLAAQQDAYVELVKEHARLVGDVVVVDLTGVVLESAAKFVTYSLWPRSAYSVVLSRSASKCKISIGYNPWSAVPRKHNIAVICERHGGGGHPVVGAISLRAGEADAARALMHQIAEELSH
jgi:hypothetical protein